jgi:hypothetical protein
MAESFDDNVHDWTGGYGGKYQVTQNGVFQVTERVSARWKHTYVGSLECPRLFDS